MITFSCETCGKSFTVADELAGRKAKCKACGSAIVVPDPQAADDFEVSDWLAGADLPSAPTPPERKKKSRTTPRKEKPPVRTRRLIADAEMLIKALHGFPLIQLYKKAGNPPEIYQIIYHVRGLVRGPDGKPIYRDGHVVEIQLSKEYPRQSPKCKMITPVFHPNIEPAAICVGDHWTAGERLVDLVIRIGEMISYQAYNIQSPLDGEAAMWADQNAGHLPIDNRDLRPPNLD